MNTAIENIKDHATSVDSLGSKFEDELHTIVLQLEIERITMDKENSLLESRECESRLSDSTRQQKIREEDIIATESLADWGVVACVFLSNLITALDHTGFGVFYPYLVEYFDATTADVGWCYSFNGFVQSAVALFATYPIKSYGCRLPGVVGCLLFSFGLSLSYLAPNLATLYFTYGVIAGSGSGLIVLSSGIIIHQRFTRNRNLASGISWVGFSLGGIIGSIVTNQIIQMYSWRGALLILAAIHAQRIPLCLFFRTPKRLTSRSNDASGGTSSQRISGQMILRYLKETFNFSILRHVRYSVYAIAYFLHVFCVSGFAYHTVNRAIHVGLSRDQGVTAMSLISSTSTVIRVFVSLITNHPKVKSSLVFGTGMFFAFLSIVAIFLDPGIVGTMISTVLFGIHTGCTTTLTSVVTVDIVGVALLPRGSAILQFIAGFAKLASSPFIGWVYDVTRNYNKAFAIIGCMAFVSGSLMVALTVVTRYCLKSKAKDNEIPLSKRSFPKQLESDDQT